MEAIPHIGFTPMKTLCWTMALLALLLSPGAARADMGFPGEKRRELRLVIDNFDDYPGYYFFWVSLSDLQTRPPYKAHCTPREHRFVGSGEYTLELVLVAVPRELVGPDGQVEWEALAKVASGVLHSDLVRVIKPSSVFVLWPYDYETRHYTVAVIDKRLTLKSGPVEQGTNGPNSWVPGIIAALAVFGLGVWGVWRVRRRRRSPVVSESGPCP